MPTSPDEPEDFNEQMALFAEGRLAKCEPAYAVCFAVKDKFAVDYPTAKRVVDTVLASWAKLPALDREMRREHLRRCLLEIARSAAAAGSYGSAVQALDKLAKVDGLYEPERSEVNIGMSPQAIATSDPDRIRRRIAELRERCPQVFDLIPPPEKPEGTN